MALREWYERTPGVDAVRPPRCPSCDAAARPIGAPLGLVGHGLRAREVLGPFVPDGKPQAVSIQLRRYRCRACDAVCTVGPAEVMAGRRYSGAAILLALALWLRPRCSACKVRRQVSPYVHVGATAAAGWASLHRWTRADLWPVASGIESCRELARRIVDFVLRYSPLEAAHAAVHERAFAAAAHVDRGPSC